MEKTEIKETSEQVNVLLSGEVADDFLAFMESEIYQTKSAAGFRLIVESLRRWKEQRGQESER